MKPEQEVQANLEKAVFHRDVTSLLQAIDEGANANYPLIFPMQRLYTWTDPDNHYEVTLRGGTLLHLAVILENMEAVEALCEAGADPMAIGQFTTETVSALELAEQLETTSVAPVADYLRARVAGTDQRNRGATPLGFTPLEPLDLPTDEEPPRADREQGDVPEDFDTAEVAAQEVAGVSDDEAQFKFVRDLRETGSLTPGA